eukprot:66262-Pyramimonas_sp.AAC.1
MAGIPHIVGCLGVTFRDNSLCRGAKDRAARLEPGRVVEGRVCRSGRGAGRRRAAIEGSEKRKGALGPWRPATSHGIQ